LSLGFQALYMAHMYMCICVPPPFQAAKQHLEDNQSHAFSGEYE
jgi:hypothetical protein